MAAIKCSARNHLRGSAFALYDAAMQLTAASAQCGEPRIVYASLTALRNMTGYCEESLTRARAKLVAGDWFVPKSVNWVRDQRRSGQGGKFESPEFEALDHDTWAAAHPGKCTVGIFSVHGLAEDGSTVHAKLEIPSTVNSKYRPRSSTPQSLSIKPEKTSLQGSRTSGDFRRPKRRQLSETITRKLKSGGDDEPLADYVNDSEPPPDWFAATKACATFLGYPIDPNRADVSAGFAAALAYVWEKHGSSPPLRGILASKVIDECRGGKALWPEDFQHHRDALRRAEKRE